MASFVVSPSKFTSAIIPVVIDFSSQLASGEAVTAVTCAATVFSGTDATPSALLSGAVTLATNIATQIITGGLSGVIYTLTFSATTNTANRIIIQTYIAVTDSNPFQ